MNGVGNMVRAASVQRTAKVTAAGLTALWTPPSDRYFRLMGVMVMWSANATVSGGQLVDLTLFDGSAEMPLAFSAFLPNLAASLNVQDNSTGWVPLGNGFRSATLGNALQINLSHALTAGAVRVTVSGTEE